MILRKIIFQPQFLLAQIKNSFIKNEIYFLYAFCFFLAIMTFITNYLMGDHNEFSELAWSFVHGKTYFINWIENVDIIVFNNHQYWHLPPFPAILLMPFVFLIQGPIDQSLITFLTNIIFFFILYSFIRKNFNFNKTNTLWLTLAFFFSSVFINATLIAKSYTYAHLITSIFLILSFNEYFNKKRYWLIGIFISCCFMSRYTLIFTPLFFIALIIFEKNSIKTKFKNLVLLTLPIFIAGLSILGYNYLRFDNSLISGYKLTLFHSIYQPFQPYGTFSLKYIPGNFFHYFLDSFTPYYQVINGRGYHLQFPFISTNPAGTTSFFIISPLFLYLFKTNWKNKLNSLSLLMSGLLIFVLLCYYFNAGFPQVGSRYMIDALPFLFLALLITLNRLRFGIKTKLLIFCSILLNLYLFYSLIFIFY